MEDGDLLGAKVKTVYIRVVSESGEAGIEELTRVLSELLKRMPGASLSRPIEPHPSGGGSKDGSRVFEGLAELR